MPRTALSQAEAYQRRPGRAVAEPEQLQARRRRSLFLPAQSGARGAQWAHARVGRAGKLHQWPRAAANSCRKRAGRSQLSRTAEERLRNYGATYPRGGFDLSVISVDKT